MGSMKDHYFGDRPYPSSAGWKEPTTSRDAAKAMSSRSGILCERVLRAIHNAGPAGLTADQAAARIGALPNKGKLPKKSRGCPKSPTILSRIRKNDLLSGGMFSAIRVKKCAIDRAANTVFIGGWVHPFGKFCCVVALTIIVVFAPHQHPSVFFDVEHKTETHNVLASKYVPIANESFEVGLLSHIWESTSTAFKEINIGRGLKFLSTGIWRGNDAVGHWIASSFGGIENRGTLVHRHLLNVFQQFQNVSGRAPIISDNEFNVSEGNSLCPSPINSWIVDFDREKGCLQLSQGFFGNGGGFFGGANRAFRVAYLYETKKNKSASDEGQESGRPEKTISIFGQIASQAYEQSIGFLFCFLGIEFVLGLLGAKYLYDDRRLLGSSILLSGVLLICFGGWLL
jgi:hypothetical protein